MSCLINELYLSWSKACVHLISWCLKWRHIWWMTYFSWSNFWCENVFSWHQVIKLIFMINSEIFFFIEWAKFTFISLCFYLKDLNLMRKYITTFLININKINKRKKKQLLSQILYPNETDLYRQHIIVITDFRAE